MRITRSAWRKGVFLKSFSGEGAPWMERNHRHISWQRPFMPGCHGGRRLFFCFSLVRKAFHGGKLLLLHADILFHLAVVFILAWGYYAVYGSHMKIRLVPLCGMDQFGMY